MSDDHENPRLPKTLSQYFDQAFRDSRQRRRPISIYLMFAMLLVVLMGAPVVYIKDNPKQFAFYLSLYFIFFLMVMFRALVEFMEIVRDHFHERESIFKNTLGDVEFTSQLGKRVAENSRD